MKKLKFDHNFAKDIVSRERSTTLRIDDKDIHVGERVQLVDKVSSNKPQEWVIPGEIIIIGVQEFRLANLPMELTQETEIGKADEATLYAFLRRFYGEQVNENTVVKLLQFEFRPYDEVLPYMDQEEINGEESIDKVFLYADGGSRGNPGPSAAGFVVQHISGKILQTWNKYLGITTNNQAEYHALIAGLEWCKQHQVTEVSVRLDSLLVVNQIKGIYKVKNRDLWTLYESAKKLQSEFKVFEVNHVPRELNKLADAEVNKALDAIKGDDVVQ